MRQECARTIAALSLIALVIAATAAADDIQIGVYSQKESRSHASAGGHINVKHERNGKRKRNAKPKPPAHTTKNGASEPASGGATDSLPPAPTLPSDSPLLGDPSPAGAGTFWYTAGNGDSCIYVPNGTPLCYTIFQPNGAPAAPAAPGVVAASLAARIGLSPGQIQASPARVGLTATPSWFWLDPVPVEQTLTITVGGETVTVNAKPSIAWSFGDGATLAGGPGIRYRQGPPPPAAVVHTYLTRCLPGDRGHNPYVLATCGTRGYPLEVSVSWQISYRADGPVNGVGELPTRTTASGRAFPVTETRAFLAGPHP